MFDKYRILRDITREQKTRFKIGFLRDWKGGKQRGDDRSGPKLMIPHQFTLRCARLQLAGAGGSGWLFLLISGVAGCSVSNQQGRVAGEDLMDRSSMPTRVIYEAAVRGTAMGLLTNPVTTTGKGIHVVHKRGREFLPPVSFMEDEIEAGPGSAAFDRALDRAGIGTVTAGTIDPMVDGKAFFDRLEVAIGEARHTIDWRLFIFDNDDFAVSVADRLKERSGEIRTRVLYDRLGSYLAWKADPKAGYPEGFEGPRSMAAYLRRGSRVNVRPQGNPWLTADHTKVLLFDRERAFVGGMNLGREYRSEWHDLMVEMRGPVVGVLADEFDRQWNLAGPAGDFALVGHRVEPAGESAGIPMRVLRTGANLYEIERAHLAAIRAARESIVIITPYFSSDFVAKALVESAGRGVRVDVVLPEKNNSEIMGTSNWDTARVLMEGGVRVWHYPGSSHLKAARCDSWVCFGSANLDTLSLRINGECNIAFSDRAAVERMNREVFDKDLRKAKRLRMSDLEGKGSVLAEALADQL